MSPRRLAACLALATAAACASPRTTPPPERGALARLLDLPLEHRGHALTAFVREARPRVLLEVIPPDTFEPGYGDLLPMGLDDFDILHVVVEIDDPTLVLGPGLALVAEGPAGPVALPMYAPTRDLFMAFTRERPAGSHTRHSLKSAGLPWVINLLTVGVLEIATLELKTIEVPPDDEEHARAAPRAHRLATLVTPPHGCAAGRSPCDRYYIVPRPRDELPVRIDLDLELGDTRVPDLHLTWSALLPAGKPLAARLADRFHGQPIDLEGARVEAGIQHPADPALCRITSPRCAAATTARTNTNNNTPPPAIPPPARLATPAESLAARPAWSRDKNDAPATTLETYDPADLIPGGPLHDALLVCDFTVRGGSDPDQLVAELRVGASRVHRPEVHRHGDQARVVVPLLHLDPGEPLGFAVWRRTSSWFWGVQNTLLGRATLPYKGTLPLAHDARGLRLACVALGRDGIEREVADRVAALTKQLASFDLGDDPISEGSPDWGIGSWGMTSLQRRVEAIAGLVGWSDPRIAALLPALAHYHAVYTRHLTRLIASKQAPLPAPGALLSFERGDLRVIGSLCGDAIDRKRVLWARDKVPNDGCVTVIEVIARSPTPLEPSPRTGSLGSIWQPEFIWADGRRVDAWAVGAEPLPGKRRDPERLILAPGESARFYLAPERPWHRDGDDPPVLLYALDALDPVYIRLR